MKFVNIVLSLIVAVMAGLLAFSYQAGRLPFASESEPVEEPVVEQLEVAVPPLLNAQTAMIDELVSSLQTAHQEANDSRLRLDKRERNLQELYSSYLQLRKTVEGLQTELGSQLIKVGETQAENFKTLSGVYSKMEPGSAARSLKHMDPERVALILSQMDSRAMAAIMDSAVGESSTGGETVASWADAIRRLNNAKGDES